MFVREARLVRMPLTLTSQTREKQLMTRYMVYTVWVNKITFVINFSCASNKFRIAKHCP